MEEERTRSKVVPIIVLLVLIAIVVAEAFFIADILKSMRESANYTAIVDKTRVLTDETQEELKKELWTFNFYDVLFYVAATDSDELSQEYAETLAKDAYDAYFNDERNSIVITIAFSYGKGDETGGDEIYYSICCGPNVGIPKDRLLSELRENSKKAPELDPQLRGVIMRCIKYFSEFDYKEASEEEIIKLPFGSKEIKFGQLTFILWISVLIYFALVSVIAIVGWRKQRKQVMEYEWELMEANDELKEYKEAYMDLKEKMDDQMIDDMPEATENARKFDEEFGVVETLDVVDESFPAFMIAVHEYDLLDPATKSRVKTDMWSIVMKLRELEEKM